MLIKNYKSSTNKSINNSEISLNNELVGSLNGVKYPTTPLNVFDIYNNADIFNMINEQYSLIEKEAALFFKYWWLTKFSYEQTLNQYKKLFYLNWYFYKIEDVKSYVANQEILNSTTVNSIFTKKENLPVYEISRTAIRNITGYTPYFTPTKWEWPTVYVERQDRLIEDENELILVLGSRQIWKSYSLSEKAVEESFIPNNEILVWAFTAKSTNIIRNNIRKFIWWFPDWDFVENKKEWYIMNMKSGSHIYFSTLADDAVDSVRWKTLSTILVDEAQLVSEYAYTEVLEPTLATTWGKMILIWTPPKTPVWYFVDQIFAFKRWELTDTSFYEIKVQDQPFTHPDKRAKVMARQHEPRIQREWFCNLNSDTEQLFKLEEAEVFPPQTDDYFYVFGIDPARKKDRSWYSLHQVWKGKVTTILSGFVPDAFKKDWNLQAVFFKKLLENYPDVITVMDISWVWDWVYTIFKNAWLKINYTVRYTAGQTLSNHLFNYTVAKSILINTLLDFISEEVINYVKITNEKLYEELLNIQETETRTWIVSFKTRFFDDITNSLLISCFIIKQLKLLSKTPKKASEVMMSSWIALIDWIEWLWSTQTINDIW